MSAFSLDESEMGSYTNLLRMLYGINIYNPVKLGLENMLRLNELIGNPLKGLPVIHVAGTNGKGSVATKVARSLEALGIRTGLFTSPHISSFRERIQVNGELLTTSDVEEILAKLFRICEKDNVPATFFEITTALAFLKFQRSDCQAVVLEVGLGGRLDATNIVTPAVSIITAIQLDHTSILGNTIEAIAREKAGIIKNQVEVVVGPGCPQHVMREVALANSAPYFNIEDLLDSSNIAYKSSDCDTDDLNTDLTKAALKVLCKKGVIKPHLGTFDQILTNNKVKAALKSRPICRFEAFRVDSSVREGGQRGSALVVLDIAHNVDAMEALVRRVKKYYHGKIVKIVVGMSADKDVQSCMAFLLDMVGGDGSRIYCTQARHPRAISHAELRTMLSTHSPSAAHTAGNDDEDVGNSIRKALRSSTTSTASLRSNPADAYFAGEDVQEVVVVCGSAFVMSQARASIGIEEPRDSEELQAGYTADKKAGDNLSEQMKYTDAQEYFGEKPKI